MYIVNMNYDGYLFWRNQEQMSFVQKGTQKFIIFHVNVIHRCYQGIAFTVCRFRVLRFCLCPTNCPSNWSNITFSSILSSLGVTQPPFLMIQGLIIFFYTRRYLILLYTIKAYFIWYYFTVCLESFFFNKHELYCLNITDIVSVTALQYSYTFK